jgi:LmbE family N-acetylglucosaminyl deacetylase
MTILGVGAHPDDLDFGAAGTFAKWVKEGHHCYHLICTDGRKGTSDTQMTEDNLVRLRRKEQKKVAEILGLKDVYFLTHHDTELMPDLTLKKEIVRFIRKLKPDIIVTLDPSFIYSRDSGYINHTDHRAAGLATLDAVFPLARDRLTFSELEREGLEPHKVKTVYLTSFENPNEILDITDTIDVKLQALRAHGSQISEQALGWVKERAKTTGAKKNFKYAESFIKLELPF